MSGRRLVLVAALSAVPLACGPSRGKPVPRFSARALDGHVVSAEGLRGRPALVLLWSPACFACVHELDVAQGLADAMAGRLAVVGLFQHGRERDARDIAAGEGLRIPLAKVDGATMRSLCGWDVPTALVVGADGTVAHVLRGAQPREVYLRALADVLPRAR